MRMHTKGTILLVIGLIMFSIVLQNEAKAAPPVGIWRIVANGFEGELTIDDVSPLGAFTGTLNFGTFDEEITGNWSETRQKILFRRILDPFNPASVQIYRGFAFEFEGVRHMAGSFRAGSAAGGTPQRREFGWFAELFF